MKNDAQRKKRRPILIILVAFLIIIGLCFVSVWVAEMPRYITFDIPSPDQFNTELADWDYAEYSILENTDGKDKFYIWRTQADFYGSIPQYHFDSLEGVLSYLDDNLEKHGWERVGEHDSCSRLTERNFLEDDETYKYIEIGNEDPFSYRIVCIFIWQTLFDWLDYPIYTVIITSINPSFLTEIRYGVR